MNFATDTYSYFSGDLHNVATDMIKRNGRPIIGLIFELWHLSGLSNISFYYFSSVSAIILLGISIWIYQEILRKYNIKENTRILLSFAGIANIFIVDYFMFVEKCGFMLAVLFNVIAVWCIEKFFTSRETKYFVFSLITMILAIFTYQGTIGLFVLLSIPFAMRNADNIKKYFLKLGTIGVVYAVPVAITFLTFKFLLKSTRLVENTNYIESIKLVIKGICSRGINTFYILPSYLFLTITFIIFISVVFSSFAHKRNLRNVLNIFFIIITACVIPTATILQGSGYWVPRAVYPMASIAGVLAINLFVNNKESQLDKLIKKGRGIVLVSVIVLLIAQFFSFNRLFIDKYKVNALDQYRCQYIKNEISKYQESSGIEIKKIAFYKDSEPSLSQYLNIINKYELDSLRSSFYASWSDINAINYYLHTNYVKINPVEEYKNKFTKRNWNGLSSEQLEFKGDTLHLCVY